MAHLLYSIKLYLLLILLPQLVYFFTKNSYGLAAVCESCSPTTYIDMYLSLLRDPASFTDDESVKSSESLGQATQSQCAIGDVVAANGEVVHTKYIVSANDEGSDGRHIARLDSVREPRDETPVSSPCFCTSREFNNFSSDEEASLQSASDESEGGGWYGNDCSNVLTMRYMYTRTPYVHEYMYMYIVVRAVQCTHTEFVHERSALSSTPSPKPGRVQWSAHFGTLKLQKVGLLRCLALLVHVHCMCTGSSTVTVLKRFGWYIVLFLYPGSLTNVA